MKIYISPNGILTPEFVENPFGFGPGAPLSCQCVSSVPLDCPYVVLNVRLAGIEPRYVQDRTGPVDRLSRRWRKILEGIRLAFSPFP